MDKLKVIRTVLDQIIKDIDSGNSNMTEEEMNTTLETLNKLIVPETKYSKYQACGYLNISRATFDNLVKNGKIPEGRKQQGFKEKFWYLKDLKQCKK